MTSGRLTIMLGDSLTAGNGWGQAFPKTRLRNLGLNGDTAAGVWGRLDQVVDLKPDRIFLQIGINDFLRGAWPDEIGDLHLRIWDEILERLPQVKLHVISMLPFVGASFPGIPPTFELILLNRQLAEEAEKRSVTFIDLFCDLADENHQLRLDYTSDGLHLLPEAYRVWENRLRPFIN